MFNIGLIGAAVQGQAVKLTPRQLNIREGSSGTFQSYVSLHSYGGLGVSSGSIDGPEVEIPGEYLPTISPGAGSIYQSRATRIAGNNLTNGTANSWQALTSSRTYGWIIEGSLPAGFGGRILVEIRLAATQEVVASAMFWTSGYEP